MHILNVQLKYIIGGNPQVCLDYTRMLTLAGNQVTALVNPSDPFINEQKSTGAKVILSKRIGELGPYDIFTILYFKKIIREVRPDLIIIHEGRQASLMKLASGGKVPIIDVNHCRSPKQSRNTEATIVTNTSRMADYKKSFGDGRLVYYLSNAIDAANADEPSFCKVWGEVPVIGVMSRFVHHKGIDIFIDALAILNKRQIKFHAKIAGDGEDRGLLEEKIAEYNLQNKITMPGYTKDIVGFYKSIDIFCLPSRHEEFGLVVLWAYKYGVPVVLTDTEGPSDIAVNGVDSLIVQRKNPEELADALQKLLLDNNKANKFAEAGYKKLQEKYDIKIVAKQLQNIVEEVVAKKSCKNISRKAA